MSGGDQPVWRRDGKELFYVDAQRFLQRVPVLPSARLGRADPEVCRTALGYRLRRFASGTRVYFPHPGTARSPREFGVVLGWMALLER